MFLLAFFAFLKVGEITVSNNPTNILKMDQIHEQNGHFAIVFYHYKHSKGKTHVLRITPRNSINCPVKALNSYLSLRGNQPGSLFITSDQHTVTRSLFSSMLKKCIQFLKLNTDVYKSHSFRIGAASHAAQCGMSDAQIRHLGRWSSQAFMKYIRL